MRVFYVFVSLVIIQAFIVGNVAGGSVFVYKKPKIEHFGKEITPLEAYSMVKMNPDQAFVVDVRTRGEYQFVGHPKGAVLAPFLFMGTKFNGKEYELMENPNFAKSVLARFNLKTDTLFFICRSGTRAAMALNALVNAGWPADRAYVVLGGFEGNKIKDENSGFNGHRVGGGWRNEGLPWTYSMDAKHIY